MVNMTKTRPWATKSETLTPGIIRRRQKQNKTRITTNIRVITLMP